MSDSQSRAAETEEALEEQRAEERTQWALDNPCPFSLGQSINRTKPWTGETVKVTGKRVNRRMGSTPPTWYWSVQVNKGLVYHDPDDFQPSDLPFHPGDVVRLRSGTSLDGPETVKRCFWENGYIKISLEAGFKCVASQWTKVAAIEEHQAAIDEMAEVERAQEAKFQAEAAQMEADLNAASAQKAEPLSAQAKRISQLELELKAAQESKEAANEALDEYIREVEGLDEDDEDPEPSDVVEPNHYNVEGAPNCGDIIDALGLGYHDGCAMKYLYRAGRKTPDPRKDISKAIQSLTRHLVNLEAQDWSQEEMEAMDDEEHAGDFEPDRYYNEHDNFEPYCDSTAEAERCTEAMLAEIDE